MDYPQDGKNVQFNLLTRSQAAQNANVSGNGNYVVSYYYTPIIESGENAEIVEPVSVQDCKDFSHVDLDDDDDKIKQLIKHARHLVEEFCMVSLIPVEVEAKVVNQTGGIILPGGNVKDEDGNSIDTSTSWSGIKEMTYQAGWKKEDVPMTYKVAIMTIVDNYLNDIMYLTDEVRSMLNTIVRE